MSNSPTPIITDTAQLSKIADAVLARLVPGALTKNTLLNIIAAEISGPKHNWGYLRSASGPIIGRGVNTSGLTPQPSQKIPGDLPGLLIDNTGLTITLAHPSPTGAPWTVVLPAMESLVLSRMLEDGGANFGAAEALVESDGNTVIFRATHADGAIGSQSLPLDSFLAYLRSALPRLLNGALESSAGDALHTAFVMVAETQNEIVEMADEADDAEAFSSRVDVACREAVRIYIQEAAHITRRIHKLRDGARQDLIDDVIDNEWDLLLTALGKPDAG